MSKMVSIVIVLIAVFFPAAAGVFPVELREPEASQDQQLGRADIPRNVQDEYDIAQKGANILEELARTPDRGIPRELLDRAYGVAAVPNVLKGAFILGGRWGKGLLSVRRNGEWGPPIFIQLAGGSLGFQVGVESMDLVLVFTERGSVQSLLDSKITLGVNASVAAGPVGRHAAAATDAKLDAAIYSYSRAKGFFVGIALDGAMVSPDENANREVYGMSGQQVLRTAQAGSPVTQPFLAALRQYSPAVRKNRQQ